MTRSEENLLASVVAKLVIMIIGIIYEKHFVIVDFIIGNG